MLFAFIYIFFYLISICLFVVRSRFNSGCRFFYFGVPLMNDLNAFNVYLSDCHTECNANDCCERVAAYKQKTSKRYVCRLSLESKR